MIKKGWGISSSAAVVAVLVLFTLATTTYSQNQFQVQEGSSPGGPRVLSKNTNDVQKMIEKQDIQEDDWQADDLKVVKEEGQKTSKEEAMKRNQDDINTRQFEVQSEKQKDSEDKMFQGELETKREQGKKKAQEQEKKSAQTLAYEQKEDIKRFKQNVRHAKRREQLVKKKLQLEREKLEFIYEQGEKKQKEQKRKMESEQGMKADAEKAKARAQEELIKQETFLKQQQEQRTKQAEQSQKTDAQRAESAKEALAKKDEQHNKGVQKKYEELQKQKDRLAEQKQKQAEQEQKTKQQQQEQEQKTKEQKNKRCTPVQVWSAGWPHNVWQFKVKDNIYRKEQYGFRRGYNVLVLKPNTYAVDSLRAFDTYASQHESRNLAAHLRNIPNGSVIMIACQDECSHNREAQLRSAFAAVGFHQAQSIGFRHSYAGLVVKGKGGAKEQWPRNNHMVSVSDRFNCD